jgi:hypothetical protein
VNNTDFTLLSRFVTWAQKRFALSLLAGCFTDARPQPEIPSRAVGLSLVLGEVVHIPSLLQLQAETRLPQWQRWVGYAGEISHDTFGYASARMDPDQLRRAGIWICRKLKRGNAFEPQILSQAEAAFSSPRGFLHWVGEQVRFLSFAHAAGLIFTAPVPFELLEIHHNSRLVRVA